MTTDSIDSATGTEQPDPVDLHRRASAGFAALVHQIEPSDWTRPTPCAGWDVRELVNHIVGENLWTAPLMSGRTIEEVGDAYDGDVLGGDPLGAWDDAAASARDAADAPGAVDRTVQLSFGAAPAAEYLMQLFADHLIHGWDLAQAIGADAQLDPTLVAACATWFDAMEEIYRSSGAVGPRPVVAIGADGAAQLLARFGRSDTLAVIERFNGAVSARDVDAMMAAMTDDCVFESTDPAPDGRRFSGQEAVRAVWTDLFAASPTARFDSEETVVAGDRATVRWTYHFDGGHVRGVDVLRVRDGRVAEKLSYVKG